MWPWNKKKKNKPESGDDKSYEFEEGGIGDVEEIKPEDIASAIVELRTPGAHFGISYAQMNGYNEKLTNPLRFSEIVELIGSEPNFSDEGIDFATACQMEELEHYASNPEGTNYKIPGFSSNYVSEVQKEENDKRWAREILHNVKIIGEGSLEIGFKSVGFDFKNFLVSTVLEMREADLKAVDTKVAEKKSVLRPIFLRAYSKGRNKYGEIEYGHIFKEAEDFFEQFFPKGTLNFFFLMPPLSHVARIALIWADDAKGSEEQPTNGIDFEHWCAQQIEDQGWSVVISKASGDQGVDVIASRESLTVAVQCKRYNSPIGNKAVQEAFTGSKHYNADLSVVIGTGGFTRSAQEVANTTNVILLDAEMIKDFTSQVMDRL